MPKFSIITPVNLWNLERTEQFLRCIESVRNQTFKDFEWVIIDDGSTEKFLWKQVLADLPTKVIHKQHGERVIAYNSGFKKAKGEWWLFLDSDDELTSDCLDILDKWIQKMPYLMFNFGCIYKYKDGKETKKPPFRPKWMGKKYGHEVFGGGNIVNGTFIFSRKIWEKLGGYPPNVVENIDCSEINYGGVRELFMNTPYDFSAYYQLKFPELRRYFMVDHINEPNKILKELGNPWGQDFAIFYKYTRKYHSKPIEEYLYIVHPKA